MIPDIFFVLINIKIFKKIKFDLDTLLLKKYASVLIILIIQFLMVIGLWIFPEAKGKISIKDIKSE